MLVVYFKNDNTSFREQRLSLTGDFTKHVDWSKAQNCQYLVLEAKNAKKNKGTLFSQTLKVGENEVPLFLLILAYFPRYDHFLVLHDFLYKMRISSANSMKKEILEDGK